MQLPQLGNFRIDLYDVKDQLKQHVYNRSMEAFAEGDRARDALRSVEEVEARRSATREALIEALGGLPSSDYPLTPQVKGTVQGEGFRIEKVIFQSRPQTYVTSNLYLPEDEGSGTPRGAVLFLCGHHDEAKEAPEYQIVCQYLVRAGLVVLAMDPIGQGERFSYYESALHKEAVSCGTVEHDYAGTPSWLLGDSIARYFVHDAMRAVDYLCSRPEVDPDRIGVTGNSGGGTQTSLLMICDPRLAAAALATFIMNRRSYLGSGQAQDAEQIWPGMSVLGFDHEDILMAMVPRPVLVLAAAYDFFPVEGTRDTVTRSKRIWDLYSRGELLQYLEEPVDHRFTVAMAKAAAAFFSSHLLRKPAAQGEGEIRPMERSLLWCTRHGQIREEMGSQARAVHEENADRLRSLENSLLAMPEHQRKERALSWLRERVFAGRSEPCELNPRYVSLGQMNELAVQSVVWCSQKDIMNHGMLFRNDLQYDGQLPLTVAVWDNGTRGLEPHLLWIRDQCRSGRAVLVLDVTGTAALTPNAVNAAEIRESFGTIYKLTTDLLWLGDSLAAIRTYDVLRAFDMAGILNGVDSTNLSLYASGRHGLYALLASAIDPRVGSKDWELHMTIESMADWVRTRYYDNYDSAGLILPGMLQYFDLPDFHRWAVG